MIHTIKVTDPSSMERMLVLTDPFHDESAMGRSSNWCPFAIGFLVARFVTKTDIKEGIDYIIQCEENNAAWVRFALNTA